ncbi:response regulator [Thalassobacillus sp. B23F22_16]|uniref:response regulator n=1 Tax=Thalassobacillus sp. B23F22_16 TaxID=3459513 RepID=UPI00373F8F3B
MLRLMAVDDEWIEREGLKKIIANECPGADVVAEAANGRQAIETALEAEPDIILMDIKMPGIDGVEAVTEIKKNLPNTRFIMVSAFDTFEYAKNVMQQGVKEYLLKPSRKQEVVAAVRRVEREIVEESRQVAEKQYLERQFNKALKFMQSEWALSMLVDHMQDLDLTEWSELLDINITCGYAMVIDFRQANDRDKSFAWVKEYIRNHSKDVQLFSPNHEEKLPVFFLSDQLTGTDKSEFLSYVLPFVRNLLHQFEKQTGIRMHVGIGTPYASTDEMNRSYHEALHALEHIKSSDQVTYLFADKNNHHQSPEVYAFKREKELLDAVKNGDISTALEQYSLYLKDQQVDGLGILTAKMNELFIIVTRMMNDMGIQAERFDHFSHFHSYSELEEKCVHELRRMVEKVNTWRAVHAKGKLGSAMDYMKEKYANPLTLEEVAAHVDLSPYYLSKLFKEKKGVTFIEYLTGIRVGKAKELMNDPVHSLKEICFKVGYKDPNYFSRVFKKKVGRSPNQYRKQAQFKK